MTTVVHVVLLVGLAIAVTAIFGWVVWQIIDFIKLIFRHDGNDGPEDLR